MLSEKIGLEFDIFEVPDRKFGSYEKVGPKVYVCIDLIIKNAVVEFIGYAYTVSPTAKFTIETWEPRKSYMRIRLVPKWMTLTFV